MEPKKQSDRDWKRSLTLFGPPLIASILVTIVVFILDPSLQPFFDGWLGTIAHIFFFILGVGLFGITTLWLWMEILSQRDWHKK